MHRVAVVVTIVCLLFATAGRASNASPASPYTPLIVHLNGSTTLSIAFSTATTSPNCALQNSGSPNVGVDMGSASKTTASSCATFASGSPYTLTTNIGIDVTCSGTCATWNLSLALASAQQTDVQWQAQGTNLSTTPLTLATGLAYGSNLSGAIDVKVTPVAGAPTVVQQTVNITATDSTTSSASATGTISFTFSNEPGISILLKQDSGGVALTGGAFAAAIDLGTVSAYGSLSAGVTRPSVTASNYTVETIVDIDVENGGVAGSTSYTLQSELKSAAPTGLTYKVDAVTLTTSLQTVTSTGTYGSNAAHTISVVISSSAPGSGGPAVGSSLADTLNFTATSN